MTQEELQWIAVDRLGTSITATTDEFCTFDGYSDEYVIEFKCRRKHYDTQLIEHKKYTANLDQADESGKEFLYIISTPEGEYVFNCLQSGLSKMAADGTIEKMYQQGMFFYRKTAGWKNILNLTTEVTTKEGS